MFRTLNLQCMQKLGKFGGFFVPKLEILIVPHYELKELGNFTSNLFHH